MVFGLNRAVGGRVDPHVGSTSSDAPAVLPAWSGRLTVLGSFLLQAACLQADGWSCPCGRFESEVAGPVEGWCGAAPSDPSRRAGDPAR